MGICMKDHPVEDIMEKIEDVEDVLEENVVSQLRNELQKNKWEQPALNELFHALKKLEKNITDEEKIETLQKIQSFLV